MKCTSIEYQSLEDLKRHVVTEKLVGEKLLIFVFTNHLPEEPRSVLREMEEARRINCEILDLLPGATLMGCSSAGIIGDGHVLETGTVITFCHFENMHPRGACYSLDQYAPAVMVRRMKEDILREDSKMLFLLTDGLEIKAQQLLRELSLEVPHLPMAGGKAGDDLRFEQTFVYYNRQVITGGAVAVALNGSFLRIRQLHRLNWKKIGKKMTVTDAWENAVRTIDHQPVKEVYRRYLGPDMADNLPHSAGAVFPLILHREGMDVARVVSGQREDGSILYFGDILSGEQVHFGYGNLSLIFESLQSEYQKMASFPAEGIFIFSCIVRKSMLQQKTGDEIAPFLRLAPVTGFFTYGEFMHSSGKNQLLNATMAVTMLSESQESFRNPPENVPFRKSAEEDRHLSIIKALTHLTDTVTGELEETNRQLEEKNRLLNQMVKIDGLTKLYNHSYFHESLEREIRCALRYRRKLSVAMIDADNFKNVNDTWGHAVGDRVLADLGECIVQNCRATDMVGRCGGDEFAVIFPETGLEEAARVAERIRSFVEILAFEHEKIRLTLSIGVAELDYHSPETLMLVADKRLYRAKLGGKNSVVAEEGDGISPEDA